MQNPKVLDALVRSGRFRTREEAQGWISQIVAMASQGAPQQAGFGVTVDTWVNGQQMPGPLPGPGQQTFGDLGNQADQKRKRGRGN
jgi:hypothetical protein